MIWALPVAIYLIIGWLAGFHLCLGLRNKTRPSVGMREYRDSFFDLETQKVAMIFAFAWFPALICCVYMNWKDK